MIGLDTTGAEEVGLEWLQETKQNLVNTSRNLLSIPLEKGWEKGFCVASCVAKMIGCFRISQLLCSWFHQTQQRILCC